MISILTLVIVIIQPCHRSVPCIPIRQPVSTPAAQPKSGFAVHSQPRTSLSAGMQIIAATFDTGGHSTAPGIKRKDFGGRVVIGIIAIASAECGDADFDIIDG